MITRIVMLKLKDEFTPQRDAIARGARDFLCSRPQPASVVVNVPADASCAGSWDINFVIQFHHPEALQAWVADAEHGQWLARDILPHVEMRKAWNFETV